MTDRFIEFLKKYISRNPDAFIWVLSYITLCHLIDDICDSEVKDNEHIIKTFEFAAIVYSSQFYWSNISILYPLVKFAGNSYMDSVKLEKSDEKWKRTMADTLRQDANSVILAVIEIVNNIDIRRNASLELREISYWSHHTLEGNPI